MTFDTVIVLKKWVTNEFCIHNWATFDPLGKNYCQLNMYELLKQNNAQKTFFPAHLSITFSKCQVNLNSQILKANNIWRHYSIVLQRTRGLLLNFFQYGTECLKIPQNFVSCINGRVGRCDFLGNFLGVIFWGIF